MAQLNIRTCSLAYSLSDMLPRKGAEKPLYMKAEEIVVDSAGAVKADNFTILLLISCMMLNETLLQVSASWSQETGWSNMASSNNCLILSTSTLDDLTFSRREPAASEVNYSSTKVSSLPTSFFMAMAHLCFPLKNFDLGL